MELELLSVAATESSDTMKLPAAWGSPVVLLAANIAMRLPDGAWPRAPLEIM